MSTSFVRTAARGLQPRRAFAGGQRGRPEKAAFVDDAGAITYAQLDERVRRLAAGLIDAGVKREERVLLLMLDGADWPVAFLGAIWRASCRSPVNTLLTADDYAYMLEHSRAQAVLVSGAVMPALRPRWPSRTTKPTRSSFRARRALQFGEIEFEAFLDRARRWRGRRRRMRTSRRSGSIRPARRAGRKGTVHSHANPYWTVELYGKAVLGLARDRCLFLRREAVFRLWPRQRADLPAGGRRDRLLMAERPTPGAVFKRWRGDAA